MLNKSICSVNDKMAAFYAGKQRNCSSARISVQGLADLLTQFTNCRTILSLISFYRKSDTI
jgi:hypothetical protein